MRISVVCRDGFKRYVKSIVTRNNTLTGLPYASDPTVLAWDLVRLSLHSFAECRSTGSHASGHAYRHVLRLTSLYLQGRSEAFKLLCR